MPILNPLGQSFPWRKLKSMSEIVDTSIKEIKAHCFQHPPFWQMAAGDMEYTHYSSGRPLNWIIFSIEQ